MLYITGDTHGDFSRFKQFRRTLFTRKGRVCVVCGDFGFVWDDSPTEKKNLEKFERLGCTVLFVEGTHDNIGLLQSYPEDSVFGGRARRLAENVWWLQRGEIYEIDGKKFFAMGGGHSSDAEERLPGVTWWEDELPTPGQLVQARKNLESHGNRVDFIITHQRPTIDIGLMDPKAERANALTAFLWEISRSVAYDHWYFGGDHVDKPLSGRMTAVFRKVIKIYSK